MPTCNKSDSLSISQKKSGALSSWMLYVLNQAYILSPDQLFEDVLKLYKEDSIAVEYPMYIKFVGEKAVWTAVGYHVI